MIRLAFRYDRSGRGDLLVINGGDQVVDRYHARTGSINADGVLVHPILEGEYEAIHRPMHTDEVAMWITGPLGWKLQLHRPLGDGRYSYRGYYIHPDGPKDHPGNGTDSCIGTETDAWPLYNRVVKAFDEQGSVKISVTSDEQQEAQNGGDDRSPRV